MKNYKRIYFGFTLLVGAILWYMTFIVKPMNFWLEMAISIVVLVIMAISFEKGILNLGQFKVRYILIGILSAIGLYLVFYIGNIVSGFLFPFKDAQISMIYGNKAEGSLAVIGLLLFFVIGPGEEIYWRGFIQKVLTDRLGENKGYLLGALLYSMVHVVTFNFMVTLAALVCGLYWGWIYKKEKSLYPVLISHAIWDVTIFILLPVK